MATLVEAIPWSSPDLVPKPLPTLSPEWKREIKKAYGEVPNYVVSMTQVPWLVRGNLEMAWCPTAYLPKGLKDLVAFVVSQDNSCRYCYGAMRMLLRLFGYSEGQVRQLEADLHQAELPQVTREALEFARMVSRVNPRPNADAFRRLYAAGLTHEQVRELTAVAAYWTVSNRMASMLALAPDPIEKLEGKWYAPIVSVMMKLLLGSKLKPVPPRPMPQELRGGPFAPLVDRLDGIPVGVALAKMLRGAIDSDILPRRSKLLMFAVISRTLACSLCESGAEQLLAAEGFGPEKTQEVLRNLSSPELTPLEAQLIPLARETVRIQPQQIQEKLRPLQQKLSPPQFMELLGVLALANAASRLTVILHSQ